MFIALNYNEDTISNQLCDVSSEILLNLLNVSIGLRI